MYKLIINCHIKQLENSLVKILGKVLCFLMLLVKYYIKKDSIKLENIKKLFELDIRII